MSAVAWGVGPGRPHPGPTAAFRAAHCPGTGHAPRCGVARLSISNDEPPGLDVSGDVVHGLVLQSVGTRKLEVRTARMRVRVVADLVARPSHRTPAVARRRNTRGQDIKARSDSVRIEDPDSVKLTPPGVVERQAHGDGRTFRE